jgi:predicted permease
VVTNPLIIACGAGMLWARLMPPLPAVVDGTLRLAASVTLPLALVSIGGSLTVRGLRGRRSLTLLATALKCLILPAMGYPLLRWLGATPTELLIGMLFLAMPASTAMYVLASQLDSDASLSSATIVVSTVASIGTLTGVLLLFA